MTSKEIAKKELTEIFIQNYFDASFNFSVNDISDHERRRLIKKIISKPFQSKIQKKVSERNILIIGAGASKDAYDDLLTANEFKSHIKRKLGWDIVEYHSEKQKEKKDPKISQEQRESTFHKFIERIDGNFLQSLELFMRNPEESTNEYAKRVYQNLGYQFGGVSSSNLHNFLHEFFEQTWSLHKGLSKKLDEQETLLLNTHKDLNKLDFELTLYLLSNIFSVEQIRDIIEDVYKEKFRPVLSYEIIAIMLKNRFIDVVINFNFDELLDEVLKEEMRSGDYHHILNDGDCDDLVKHLIHGRIKAPIYIKPHGTSSVRSSMRFTKEDYLRIPKNMRDLLENILSGVTKLESNRTEKMNVNIITVGFGMASLEINEIIKNVYRPGEMKFFHFNNSSDIETTTSDNLKIKNLEQRTITNQSSIGLEITDIYNGIIDGFQDDFRPHGLWKSSIIYNIFYDEKNRSRVPIDRGRYFLIRSITEIIIQLAKNKGIVNRQDLIGSRAGKYYSLFKKALPNNDIPSTPYILDTFLNLEHDAFYNSYKLNFSDEIHPFDPANNIQLEEFVNVLWNRYLEALSKSRGIIGKELEVILLRITKKEKALKYNLKQLTKHSSYEICPRFEDSYFNIRYDHQKQNVINTRLGLKAQLSDSIVSTDWDVMLVVAKRGTLFNTSNFKIAPKKSVYFILSEDNFESNLRKKYKNNIKKLKYFPASEMEYHMTMFLKLQNSDSEKGENIAANIGWQISRCIYFRKTVNSSEISPILLSGVNRRQVLDSSQGFSKPSNNPDREYLLRIFFSYYLKGSDSTNFDKFRWTQGSNSDFEYKYKEWLQSLK